jgi:hypothetical protein
MSYEFILAFQATFYQSRFSDIFYQAAVSATHGMCPVCATVTNVLTGYHAVAQDTSYSWATYSTAY